MNKYFDSVGVPTTRLGEYLDHMEIGLCAHGEPNVPTDVIRSWFVSDEWHELVRLARATESVDGSET